MMARYLVTGANGLLGRAMVNYLLAQGESVRSFDLTAHENPQVESVIGDLRDANAVKQACEGVDGVFHVASMVYVGLGKPRFLYDVNVVGTQNVINGCVARGVSRLVYTSSIDVVFEGKPLHNGDETLPYATQHLDYYGETKTLAEKAVLEANGKNSLLTCALRTAGIYGAGDKHRFPALIAQAKAGQLARIGNGSAKFNHVYVENVAHAHYLALNALTPQGAVAGNAYFITDHPAKNFFDFTLPFLVALGFPMPTQVIPQWVADLGVRLLELRWRLSPTDKHADIVLTRYSVASLCNDFWFNSDKAKRDFGYEPIVDEQTAFTRTLDWLKGLV